MARWTGDPGISAVLEAADAWSSQCFAGSNSVLSEESLWTSKNLETLLRLFAGNPLTDKRDFLEKLNEQLTDAPPEVPKLAAEVLWFLNLFPSRSVMKPETKREQIERVWGWSASRLRSQSTSMKRTCTESVILVLHMLHTGRWSLSICYVPLSPTRSCRSQNRAA